MGYFYSELIPPAVLFNNPGLNREEFIEALEEVRSSGMEIDRSLPLDSYDKSDFLNDYNKGLLGLAYILRLKSKAGSWPIEEKFFSDWYSDGYKVGGSENQKKLVAAFPTEQVYDFTQANGVFLHTEKYFWMKVKDKYYLDPKTFDKIPPGFLQDMDDLMGYTDLIITAEAIKHKAWALFSRYGRSHVRRFFNEYPDSKLAWEKAVWDAHSSLYVKDREMSHTDFLRFRLTPLL
jgi:hypothetical protein